VAGASIGSGIGWRSRSGGEDVSTELRDTEPYARKLGIALAGKAIPFELVTEVP